MTNSPNFQGNFNHDADNAEKVLRLALEQALKDYKNILHDLAFRYAGKLMEEHRRVDPSAPGNWNPEKWKVFWEKARPIISESKSPTWNQNLAVDTLGNMEKALARIQELEDELSATKIEQETATAEAEQVREELDKLKMAIKDLDSQVRDAKQKLKDTTEELRRVKVSKGNLNASTGNKQTAGVQQKNPGEKKQPDQTLPELPDAPLPLFMEQMAGEVVNACKSLPKTPIKYEGRVSSGIGEYEARYRRQIHILYLISKYGLCIRRELERIIAYTENLSGKTKSVKKPVDELVESKLLELQILKIEEPFQTSQAIVRLTPDGKELCEIFGWSVAESEWTRLETFTKGDVAHILANLLMTMNARARGWETRVAREVEGIVLDNVIFKEGHLHYSTYVNGNIDLSLLKKIQTINDDKRISIYTFDTNHRKLVVELCKKEKLRGVATDIQTLTFNEKGDPRQYFQIKQDEPLWLEEWE